VFEENQAMDQRAALQQVVAWARGEENIRVLVLTGSVARGEDAFDELSDLDLELYVNDPSALLSQAGWYDQFGEVLVVEALQNPGWHPTRLVYYADGKIDFMIAPTQAVASGVSYDRQYQLLLDKDNLQGSFVQRPPQHDGPPTRNDFLECVHEFYAAAIMWAKYLVRDDPWSAKIRDWDSKKLLLQMVEWDQKTQKGWDLDTWLHGAHLRDWADPMLVSQIERCWCGFSRDDSVRALLNSVSLFDSISTRAALALEIQRFDSGAVRKRIERILAIPAQGPQRQVPSAVARQTSA
jgi:aminoglycoside 6-adenylyltransferase